LLLQQVPPVQLGPMAWPVLEQLVLRQKKAL
jgi:hypothetical protein